MGFGSAQDVRDAASDVCDWPAFLSIAESHRLQPLVANCFEATGVRPPDPAPDRLEAALRRNAKRVMILSEELARVLERLNGDDIPALAVKGPVSAWTLYTDPACRVFYDLDLLIPSGCLCSAREVLSRCGYEAWGPAGFTRARELNLPRYRELCLENAANGLSLDLHWDLMPKSWFAALPVDLWQRSRLVRIGRKEVRTLSEEDTFLHLCFHGAKHAWSQLGWLVDLCGLMVRSPGIATRSLRLVDPASKAGAMVRFGVASALALAPDIRLDGAIEISECTHARARTFVCRCLADSASEGSAFSRLRFQWSMGGNDYSVFRYIFQWLLTPNHEDWVSLPVRHPKLLFLLRPWRLIRVGLSLFQSQSIPK